MADRIRSLQDSAVAAVISNLGELAASNECCVGTIPEVKSVDLVYKKENGDWCSKPLQLPADLADEKLQEFFGSCSDDTYLDALKLEPECFHASFEIANTFVLDYIYRIMSLSSPNRAELHMLNVYSTGGHFKSHVDTPRSKNMFGSLVVCLPSEFTGGALVTRHQGRKVTFDWSSSTTTHWAAFFSDVEHEVLPVTSGHRITLAYNLHYSAPMRGIKDASWPDVIRSVGGLNVDIEKLSADLETSGEPHAFLTKTEQHQALICRGCGIDGFRDQIVDALKHKERLDVTTHPLYQELLRALQNPHFMREGGTLGFCLRHKYTDPSPDLEAFSLFLKGGDAVVYQIAATLQLPISLKPLLCDQGKDPYCGDDADCNYFLSRFFPHKEEEEYCDPGCDDLSVLRKAFDDIMKVNGITWIQRPEIFMPALSCLTIDARLYCPPVFAAKVYYQTATFLIEVPKITSQRGSLQCRDNGLPPAKKVKAAEKVAKKVAEKATKKKHSKKVAKEATKTKAARKVAEKATKMKAKKVAEKATKSKAAK